MYVVFGWLRARRRRRLAARPLADSERAQIARNVRYYRCLAEAERRELDGLIRVFLAEKRIDGCGGITVTDEVRLTIAAQACVLLLGRATDMYPRLASVLVYPSAYVGGDESLLEDGTPPPDAGERIGESWVHGAVVIAWDEIERAAEDCNDAVNVVYHEFAHQLDDEAGDSPGLPRLPDDMSQSEWSRVMSAEFAALEQAVDLGRPTVLDPYGAESPAEFFAVATECFFERPVELAQGSPELYRQLARLYRQDPAARMPPRPLPPRGRARHPLRRRAGEA